MSNVNANKQRMSSAELRQAFLEFFRERGHTVVASSPLVPGNDPTLLFTNAGMVQFKELFLGRERRGYVRAASSQRCVRAGGKHNDLENVGYTARHHTFFEMLGNFSFGDYFKREAIEYAWEFITGTLGIAPERLWVTVYRDDDEAADIWLNEIGVDPGRFARLGEKSNFWAMGDTGPCGPCSEIFYDHGPGLDGGPPGSPDEEGDRYVEIWNLVFMQFDRAADGELTPLPKPSVDTGMGLERVAAVQQGVHSNYDIDLFRNLISAAADICDQKTVDSPSLRVIADHIRACAFLIVDGVVPSNEGRGYVLRRIIRRAIRHGYKLGQEQPFFYRLVQVLADEMGKAYPELVAAAPMTMRIIRQEEERFDETLVTGMALLEEAIAGLSGTTLPGATAFKLYDTYGFPVDLTADIARERGLSVDQEGFEAAMNAQRRRGRAASGFKAEMRDDLAIDATTSFCGHDALTADATVVALLHDGQAVGRLEAGQSGQVVLDVTPFYAESGGQVGDVGVLEGGGAHFEVTDTQKLGGAHVHHGSLARGRLAVGDRVAAGVAAATRQATVLNHSATHLLHAALRKVLGTHVVQKGSLVAADRLRFDFAHFQAVAPDELQRIERLVNAEIRRNAPAETRLMQYDAAVAAGAIALFGEKYDDEVRVLSLGDFSTELCGGTHVGRAGDIGLFRIVSEGGVAAGVRRIEALTGQAALDHDTATEAALRQVAELVRGSPSDARDKVSQLLERCKKLERELAGLKSKLATGQGTDLAATAVEVAGARVVAARLDGADAGALREAVDQLKDRLKPAVIVLGAATGDGKVLLVAGVTPELVGRIKAGKVIAAVAARVGGKGGGRADFAQAGGTDPAALDDALAAVAGMVREQLGG